MNTAKIYYNEKGEARTIMQMVREEPEWAANRIQAGEEAIRKLSEILAIEVRRNGSVQII